MIWFKEKQFPLPISEQEFNDFVTKVVNQGSLPDTNDTAESIATLILHMPQSVSSAPLSFFADSVNKSRANAVAYAKMQEYSQKRKEEQQQAAQAAAPASNQVEPQQKQQASTSEQPESVQKSEV